MKILMINKYLRPKGGAETYILRFGPYLQEQGHQVQYFGMGHPENAVGNRVGAYARNVDFHDISLREKLRWGFRVIHSSETRQKLRQVLEDFQPELCHLNNFNYQLTPGIILEIRKWSRETGHPCRIVYTAHDYQLVCPNHMCYDGKENCEKCLDGRYSSCVKGRCIHGSLVRSFLGAAESAYWHRRGIYRELDAVICCSEFLKKKLDTDPILREKTHLLRNFSTPAETGKETGDYVLYFGRYSREKGVNLLARVAKELPDIPFVFAGAGELEGELNSISNVKNVGFQTGEALKTLIRGARFTVCPSLWHENCPFSVLESLDLGIPVLGARTGGIPELIEPGITGRLFPANDLSALKETITSMWTEPIAHFDAKDALKLSDYSRQFLDCAFPGKTVTVVVPVYNTASYLDRCLESIVNQTHRKLEILLIDDGSTDNSGAVCDRWAKTDSRIRVSHQKNIGLGLTRNVGITQAKGDAICFVDSDDYILPRTIEKALDVLRERDAVVFGMNWRSPKGKLRPRPIGASRRLYRGRELLEEFLPAFLRQEGNLPISSCAGLYDLNFLRRINWRFPSERQIIAEDVYALLELYGAAGEVAVLPDALYVYCQRSGSLTHRYRHDRFAQLKAFYHACLSLCRERHYPGEVERACASVFLDITVGCLKQEAACSNWYRIREIVNDPLVQSALTETAGDMGMKKRILFEALRHRSLHLCSFLLRAQRLLEGGGSL